MKTLTFKTNMNCDGCANAVSQALKTEPKIVSWDIDLNSPDKLLTVTGDNISAKEVEVLVQKAGFKAEATLSEDKI